MRYLVEKNGRFYFEPSPAMRKAGFTGKALGLDKGKAESYIQAQISEWDAIRSEPGPVDYTIGDGTISHCVHLFEQDPAWYRAKSFRTQDEYDLAFKIINANIHDIPVRVITPRHCRALYNKVRREGSVHKARRVMKCFKRLMRFAVEQGFITHNPASELEMETCEGRNQVWTQEEVQKVIKRAMKGGKTETGNIIPARPSVALAMRIAYDTSLPQQDILNLTWSQYQEGSLSVVQIKKRGKREIRKELWLPLHRDTIRMLENTKRTSLHIVISEETGRPYLEEQGSRKQSARNVFSRIFRRFRERAGVRSELTFQDLRRTALTEMGNRSATNAEIVSFSGHDVTSRVLGAYVKPDRQAALNAKRKRWDED